MSICSWLFLLKVVIFPRNIVIKNTGMMIPSGEQMQQVGLKPQSSRRFRHFKFCQKCNVALSIIHILWDSIILTDMNRISWTFNLISVCLKRVGYTDVDGIPTSLSPSQWGRWMIHQWSWAFSQPFKTNPHIVSVYSNLKKDAEKCQVQFQNSIVDWNIPETFLGILSRQMCPCKYSQGELSLKISLEV